jgi:heme-degrading monooxygenase HmoA
MNYVLVRHKVTDFSKWKPVYDAHLPARQAAGGTELYLLRNIDDPNEVIVLFEIEDLQKAREFVASDDLRERMQESRVIDKLDTYFLTT